MRLTTPPEFQSEAMLTGTDFAMLDRLLREEAEEHGLELHDGHGRSTWCETEMGEFGVKKRGPDVLVFARAHRPEWLVAIQEAIGEHLAEVHPELAERLAWSSLADVGRMPANFSLARVAGIRRIAVDFLRLRLQGPDLHRLATEDSIHFRLVLPVPGNTAPEWPQIGANGQVVWPKGERALHRPVFTVRAIDPEAGWIETDVFLHAGGRVTEWVESGAVGDVVGLSGPSGGGIPSAKRLILAGDETAYPAIARIIAARPDATGDVWLWGARADYPMPCSPGFGIRHRPGGVGEMQAILRTTPPAPDAFLWMAGERREVDRLRAQLLDDGGHDRHQSHIAAYWTRQTLPILTG